MRKCESGDLPRILDFYRHVAEDTADMPIFGRWIFGLHPTEDMIADYVRRGTMFCLEESGEISATVAVLCTQGEDYHGAAWQRELPDDRVATVHLLAVGPDFQRKGLARKLMLEVIDFAQEAGMSAVRLDALACNAPAHRLYESMGFRKVDVRNWYAANTGRTDFFLFEYLL